MQNLMEQLNLSLPIGILDHATIFAEAPEIERLDNGRRHDERRFARRRRQLLEVA